MKACSELKEEHSYRLTKQLLVAVLGEELIGLEVGDILEVLEVGRICRVPMAPKFIKGITNLRGDIVTVLDLANIVNIEPDPFSVDTRIVIVKKKGMLLGLYVSKVVELRNFDSAFFSSNTAVRNVGTGVWSGVIKRGSVLVNVLDLDKLCSTLINHNYL